MATGVRSAVGKAVCSLCSPKSVIAVTSCKGCSKDFCRKHFNEHRDELSQDLHGVFDQHDRLLQELQIKINCVSKSSDSKSARAILKQITEWENTIIKRVSEAAKEARADVERLFSRKLQLGLLKKDMSIITEELKEQQESESFVETDINSWTKRLKQLKIELDQPSTFETNPPVLEFEYFGRRSLIEIRLPVRMHESSDNIEGNQRSTASQSSVIQCQICLDVVSLNQAERMFFCDHICCLGCFKRYYQDSFEQITSIESLDILTCPGRRHELPSNIKWDFFQYLETKFNNWFCGEKQFLDRYHENVHAALRDSHYKKCGNPKCSEFFYADDYSRIAHVECSSCKFQQCQKCCRKWHNEHTSMNCEEYAEWLGDNDQEAQLMSYLNENCVMCPNKECREIHQFCVGGSEHYTCLKCKIPFCRMCTAVFYSPVMKPICPQRNCALKNGIHAHCCYNCYREIRDTDLQDIIQLLTAHEIDIEQELRKIPRAINDNQCRFPDFSKPLPMASDKSYCERCFKHFLWKLLWRNEIEPWELYEEHQLRQQLSKALVNVPINTTKPALIVLARQHLTKYLGKPKRIMPPK